MAMQQCQHLQDRCELCLADRGIVAYNSPAAVPESQAGAAQGILQGQVCEVLATADKGGTQLCKSSITSVAMQNMLADNTYVQWRLDFVMS